MANKALTVGELIDELLKHPMDAPVWVDTELGTANITSVCLYEDSVVMLWAERN